MKKLLLTLVLGAMASLVAAEVKTVPQEVLAWYADAMVVYRDLAAAIDKADTSKEGTAAFQAATKAIGTKNLAPRYRALQKKYPELLDDDKMENTDWVPPPEWLEMIEEYSDILETYGMGMQKIAPWYEDAAFMQALEVFSEAIGEVGDEED